MGERREGATLRMIAVAAVAGGALLAGGAASGQPSTGSSGAGCAALAPTLEARPARAAPDASFTVRGENFADRYVCDDAGPADSQDDPVRGSPARNIRVELLQDGSTRDLGIVDANQNLAFDARFEVPSGVRPGRAVVRAVGGGVPAETPLRVLAREPDEASLVPPPRATLSAGGQSELGLRGPYCPSGTCGGVAGSRVPSAERALEVRAGSEVVLAFDGDEPGSMRALAQPLDGESEPQAQKARELRLRRTGETTILSPGLPLGEHAVVVSGRASRGHSSHLFRVRVEPTKEQLLREERTVPRVSGGVCGTEF